MSSNLHSRSQNALTFVPILPPKANASHHSGGIFLYCPSSVHFQPLSLKFPLLAFKHNKVSPTLNNPSAVLVPISPHTFTDKLLELPTFDLPTSPLTVLLLSLTLSSPIEIAPLFLNSVFGNR